MKVKVKVIPKARKEKVEEFEGGLKVYLLQPPVKDKANRRLIEVIAAYFNTKKYNIKIISGHKQREKIIQIDEVN
jgi:hypothetical protein